MLRIYIYQILHSYFRRAYLSTRAPVVCGLLLGLSGSTLAQSPGQVLQNPTSITSVPHNLLIRIVRAEDERRWDKDVRDLLAVRSAVVRKRAALAAGRIGNEDSVNDLIKLLRHDDDMDVRAMAAFALGEVESMSATSALLEALDGANDPVVRARATEALGKIAAALPKEQEAQAAQLREGILRALESELVRHSASDRLSVLLGLTAALRSKTTLGGPTVASFLTHADPRVRSDAANTLARLKLKDGNDQMRKLLVNDADATVRANSARVLGATEDKNSLKPLLNRALEDKDSRVRVSAIRALASLKDPVAGRPLLERGQRMLSTFNRESGDTNELLEIAATLGRLLNGTGDASASSWLRDLSNAISRMSSEPEIGLVRISPGAYLAQLGTETVAKRRAQESIMIDWRAASSLAQALGEVAALPESRTDKQQLAGRAQDILRAMLDYKNSGITINTLIAVHSEYAIPDVLRALAAFKPNDQFAVLRKHLQESDVVIRATAAELLGELPANEANTQALIDALRVALRDKELNDAALAILDSLAKQKSAKANDGLKTALDSSDHLVRRKAVALLKINGAGDFSSRIGTVQTRNTTADYERAIARIGRTVNAVITTSKGTVTVQLLPEDAPLNVDNFVQLARRNYFAGITFHRVVPNFVIQDGDPRGDGNGGPGYQIRCEINQVAYERGAVGMALSGKDTGGSQWFATHSPQPHLDGGYTVFGRVISGMNVVDTIVRGDVIRSIEINETEGRAAKRRQ